MNIRDIIFGFLLSLPIILSSFSLNVVFSLKQLGASDVIILSGESVSEELSAWAKKNFVTQIVLGYPTRTKLEALLRGSTVNRLIKKANNADIHLIANDI